MKALVTGASSGIGFDIAKKLGERGYDIIAVAQSEQRLQKLKDTLKGNVKVIRMDLSAHENCRNLYEQIKSDDIDILINNAGFGGLGDFSETDLDRELTMIGTNISAVHILTKLFLKDMIKKDRGYILNVASIAAFMPGPLMATYYATKAYVLRLTQAIHTELKSKKSNVVISVLCPGPVDTRFNEVSGANFKIKPLTSDYVAEYALKKMFRRKLVIVPGFTIKLARLSSKIVPDSILSAAAHYIQKRKAEK